MTLPAGCVINVAQEVRDRDQQNWQGAESAIRIANDWPLLVRRNPASSGDGRLTEHANAVGSQPLAFDDVDDARSRGPSQHSCCLRRPPHLLEPQLEGLGLIPAVELQVHADVLRIVDGSVDLVPPHPPHLATLQHWPLGAWTLARRAEPGNVLRNARPALGLVAGVVVVPHFATVGLQWVPAIRPAVTAFGGILLGLDERTAALWSDGEWRAFGAGSVVVIDAHGERRFSSGEVIAGLPLPGLAR